MDSIQKRVQLFLHSCNTTAIEDVEPGSLAEFLGIQKKGRDMGVVEFNAGMGGYASAKGGGTSEIGRKRYGRKAKRKGR